MLVWGSQSGPQSGVFSFFSILVFACGAYCGTCIKPWARVSDCMAETILLRLSSYFFGGASAITENYAANGSLLCSAPGNTNTIIKHFHDITDFRESTVTSLFSIGGVEK